jgi:hypothetical protein
LWANPIGTPAPSARIERFAAFRSVAGFTLEEHRGAHPGLRRIDCPPQPTDFPIAFENGCL